MLAVWRRAATYDPSQAGVATWIFTIARNKRIDALRRVPRGGLDPNDPALQPEPPPSPDHEAEAVRWEGAIAEAVAAWAPDGLDYLMDAVGASTIPNGLDMVRTGGTFVSIPTITIIIIIL